MRCSEMTDVVKRVVAFVGRDPHVLSGFIELDLARASLLFGLRGRAGPRHCVSTLVEDLRWTTHHRCMSPKEFDEIVSLASKRQRTRVGLVGRLRVMRFTVGRFVLLGQEGRRFDSQSFDECPSFTSSRGLVI